MPDNNEQQPNQSDIKSKILDKLTQRALNYWEKKEINGATESSAFSNCAHDSDPHDKDPHDNDPNDFDRDNFDRANFDRQTE